MTMLDIALNHNRRGYTVHPLWPGKKQPLTKNGWHDASNLESQVREWWVKWPEANVGIACGPSDICVLDCDYGLTDEASASAWCERNGIPMAHAVRTGRRPGYGIQIYFAGVIPDVALWELDGCSGQIKSAGGYVLAAGCLHPSGAHYEVLWDTAERLFDIPDVVRNLKTSQKHKQTPGEAFTKLTPGEGQHDLMASKAGNLVNMGLDRASILAALIDICPQFCDPPLPTEDLEHIADSAERNFERSDPGPKVVIGKPKDTDISILLDTEQIEELDAEVTSAPLPKYPLDAWEGTIYYEFAKRASTDNFIAPEFFVEGAMTYAGAVTANRLICTHEEITARLYTVLLAPPGTGKGTTFRRMRRLFPDSRLFAQADKENLPHPCSALTTRAASENGMNDALLQYPHVLSDFEEMDTLMEKTAIAGSGGSLMSVIRSLFDDVRPGLTTAKGRPKVAELGYFSLLGAMTPNIWRRAMEGTDPYGTGLGGRFNIVASTETRTSEMLLTMDFSDLHKEIEAKLTRLDADVYCVSIDPLAQKLLAEWWKDKRFSIYNRVNVIICRKALHMAWLRGSYCITPDIMERAIALGDYLTQVRTVFASVSGEEPAALNENRVMQLLTSVYPKGIRQSRIHGLLDGIISRSTIYRVLQALQGTGEIDVFVKKDSRGTYKVFRATCPK